MRWGSFFQLGFFFGFFLFIPNIQADNYSFLPDLQRPANRLPHDDAKIEPGSMYRNAGRPTEFIIRPLEEFLKEAPAGIYLAHGGAERAFVGASLSPHSTGLLSVGGGPGGLAYFYLNLGLIQLNSHHSAYETMRSQMPWKNWQGLISAPPGRVALNPKSRERLLDPETFIWWTENVRKESSAFWSMGSLIGAYHNEHPWDQHTYVREAESYNRLYQLASAERMAAHSLDLTSPGDREKLKTTLAKYGERVGVLDLGNLIEQRSLISGQRVGPSGVIAVVQDLFPVLQPNAVVILSLNMQNPKEASSSPQSFEYFAIPAAAFLNLTAQWFFHQYFTPVNFASDDPILYSRMDRAIDGALKMKSLAFDVPRPQPTALADLTEPRYRPLLDGVTQPGSRCNGAIAAYLLSSR